MANRDSPSSAKSAWRQICPANPWFAGNTETLKKAILERTMDMPIKGKFFTWAIIFLICGFCQSAFAQEIPETTQLHHEFEDIGQYERARNYEPAQRWGRLVSPQQAGWSAKELAEIKEYAGVIGSDALLVVYNGLVILEFGQYKTKFNLHSVRKSLMSLMYGIYSDRGVLTIDKTLAELNIEDIGGLKDDEKKATIGDLLTSKSGVYHTAAYETKGMIERRPERGSYSAGEHWFYNNWDFNALVTIFNKQTGTDFFSAFQRHVATPLRMEHFRLEDTRYYYEKNKSIHPAYLFKMSALDLARIGFLYLRKGQYAGRQVLPKAWIDVSTSPRHIWDESKPMTGYGYLWQVTKDGFYAAGRGGQRLYVVPPHNLIIVHLADTSKKAVSSRNVRRLYRMILAAREPERPSAGRPSSGEESSKDLLSESEDLGDLE